MAIHFHQISVNGMSCCLKKSAPSFTRTSAEAVVFKGDSRREYSGHPQDCIKLDEDVFDVQFSGNEETFRRAGLLRCVENTSFKTT
jgi:hypothetical protein